MSAQSTSQATMPESPATSRFSELLERARQPQIGDKYTRADGRASLEVTHVSPWMVSVEMADEAGCEKHIWSLDDWKRLAENTINHGAKFEPARSNGEVRHAGPDDSK